MQGNIKPAAGVKVRPSRDKLGKQGQAKRIASIGPSISICARCLQSKQGTNNIPAFLAGCLDHNSRPLISANSSGDQYYGSSFHHWYLVGRATHLTRTRVQIPLPACTKLSNITLWVWCSAHSDEPRTVASSTPIDSLSMAGSRSNGMQPFCTSMGDACFTFAETELCHLPRLLHSHISCLGADIYRRRSITQ